MKTLKIILFFILAISISCKEGKPKPVLQQNATTATVKHYICANNCENSGGDAAGNCPVCKNPYMHNAAFHNQDLLKNGPLKVPEYTGGNPAANTNAPTQPSPAQNAQGIYHYTCAKGCFGGSGTAEKCANCGENLVHNQAYHN